jgi:hypothetical protein
MSDKKGPIRRDELMTRQDVARALGLSVRTLHRQVARGKVPGPSVVLHPRATFWTKQQLADVMGK